MPASVLIFLSFTNPPQWQMTLNCDHRITIQIILNILYITIKTQCNIKLSFKSSKKVIEISDIGDISNTYWN